MVGKDLKKKELIVGYNEATTPGLFASKSVVGTVSWVNKPVTIKRKIEAQSRYRAKGEPVWVLPRDDGKLDVEFIRPQRALTPGQICEFYENGVLLGGVFETVINY